MCVAKKDAGIRSLGQSFYFLASELDSHGATPLIKARDYYGVKGLSEEFKQSRGLFALFALTVG